MMDDGAPAHTDPERALRITQARREAGLSQTELAVKMGVPLGVIKNAEAGKDVSDKHLRAIAEVTGRTLGWFSERDEIPDEGWTLLGKLHAEVIELRSELGDRLARLEAELEEARARVEELEAERRASELTR